MTDDEKKSDENISWPTTTAIVAVCAAVVLIILICVNGCVAMRG